MPDQIENIAKFVKAGKALFTILNKKTAGRFTFKVKRFTKAEDKEIYFVSVLNGPDNYSNYRYVGTIFGTDFRHTKKSISKDAGAFKAFAWFNNRMNENNLPESVEVHHEGKCGRCGRKLTVPESIVAGYGPECINLV